MIIRATNGQPPPGTLWRLAWLDLYHEWILTLCMVLAIAAVLGPLLILMGLKQGTITTLRDRLVEDPVNREIRPLQTEQLTADWFMQLQHRPDVGFLIPTILRGSSIARVNSASGRSVVIDVIPTTDGDPLILENEGDIPHGDECVLSAAAAAELAVQAHDSLDIVISRTRHGRRETETLTLSVRAVLNARATALPRLYAPYQFVEDIETYREGFAVPARQWPGGQAVPFVSFDGVRIAVPKPLDSLTLRGLAINTGLVDIAPLSAQAVQELGFATTDTLYELRARNNTIQHSNVEMVQAKLRGREAIVLPFVDALLVTYQDQALPIMGLSITPSQAQRLGVQPVPWGGYQARLPDDSIRQILMPNTIPVDANDVEITVNLPATQHLTLPLQYQGSSAGTHAIIPATLMGILRTGETRQLHFSAATGRLQLAKSGYRGFRLYARSIDDVPQLYHWFIDQGIAVQTMAQEIERVRILDRGLTRIFWLVAVVGIAGGMAALIASLYAAVERKKKDISVLRLMGLARWPVFRFPIYQGLFIAWGSLVVAIIGYLLLATVINQSFSADLQLGQKICTLPLMYFGMTMIITVTIAVLSSLLAAWKTTCIDPAEALREE
jgi:putative ABC transport system permease protein